MGEVISLRFKYTEEEYIAAMRLYMVRSRDFIIRLVVCFFYMLAATWLLAWLELYSQILLLFIVALLIPLIIGFVGFFVMPRQRFRSDPKFEDEYFLQFSDDGIQFKTAQIDALVQWSLYTKVIENDRFYLLVYGKEMISVIPKRAFTDTRQEAVFGNMLARNLPEHFDSKRLRANQPSDSHRTYVTPSEPPDWR